MVLVGLVLGTAAALMVRSVLASQLPEVAAVDGLVLDRTDGFLYAYWRRPSAYLDRRIRCGSSSFWARSNTSKQD